MIFFQFSNKVFQFSYVGGYPRKTLTVFSNLVQIEFRDGYAAAYANRIFTRVFCRITRVLDIDGTAVFLLGKCSNPRDNYYICTYFKIPCSRCNRIRFRVVL